MTKTNLTELVFILDRSGSMEGLEKDTIGGFNSMLIKQMAIGGEVNVTTILFDDSYEVLHKRVPIREMKPVTENEYFVRGTTALLDAIGRAIHEIEPTPKMKRSNPDADRVLVVIITDGMENSSIEYNIEKINELVFERRTKRGWEFVFLGANMDAITEAGKMGIGAECSVQFVHDSVGIDLNYEVISKAVSAFRESKWLPKQWKDTIEKDLRMRG